MSSRERRALAAELRAKGRKLEGYAAVFDKEAALPGFTEVLKPGAFSASLAERGDVLALVDHDAGRVLARTRSGTLRLAEDSRGLSFSLDIPDTTHGRDVLALAERGDIGGASFAFEAVEGNWTGDRRELRAVKLHEISIVRDIAYLALAGALLAVAIALSSRQVLAMPNSQELIEPRRFRATQVQPYQSLAVAWRPTVVWATVCAGLFIASLLTFSRSSEFLYFQF